MHAVRHPTAPAVLAGLSLAAVLTCQAQAQAPPPASDPLAAEEAKERAARRDCKVKICRAFHDRKDGGGDLTCNVLKTWRKELISKMIEKAKVSWPWGHVKCTADIRLKSADLVKSQTDDKFEAQLDKHQVVCSVDRDKEDKAEIKFEFSPKVAFEKGKAVKATLNWGTIEAPALIKGAMWTATATDNTFNVLQGTLVEDINDFIGPKCDEVKDDWKGK